jgi:flagellar protein FliS
MWKDAYLESRVMAADPLELVAILYEHGIQTVEDARRHLASGDIALRAKAIAKAISIISELHGSLDHSAPGQISANLASLYEYMKYRLSIGNVQQQDAPFAEVENLLRTLGEAWSTISRKGASTESVMAEQFESGRLNMPFVMPSEGRGTAGSWSA